MLTFAEVNRGQERRFGAMPQMEKMGRLGALECSQIGPFGIGTFLAEGACPIDVSPHIFRGFTT